MNPSAPGWIYNRIASLVAHFPVSAINEEEIYLKLRKKGFIYGTSLHTSIKNHGSYRWTEEETTKVNLFDALALSFFQNQKSNNREALTESLVKFYELLNAKQQAYFKLPRLKKSNAEYLEGILQSRIQTNESVLKKNFSHLLTNALLFLDVLAYKEFLGGKNPFQYASALEATLTSTVFLALKQKEKKKKYDELLLKLFQASVRYNKLLKHEAMTLENLDVNGYPSVLEKLYILDLACLAIWDDDTIDFTEYKYLYALGEKLELKNSRVVESARFMHHFIHKHKEEISYFQYSNAVQHFYKQTKRTVSVLILRNKKRLLQEILESRELVVLLSKSTLRELTPIEKQKVKEQLLDICKSIPSLAIFLLPGGAVMLPLLVKLIPKLLPSAFNENQLKE